MTTVKNRRCLDCQKPCSGVRCAQHAAAARIGVPRGAATDGPRERKREPSTSELYPLPAPSTNLRPLTYEELQKAKCDISKTEEDICFPDNNASIEAKIFCHGCPIQARCLTLGVKQKEPIGIWGGATVGERKKIRRKYFRLFEEAS